MLLSFTSSGPDSFHNKPVLPGNILLFPKVTLLLIKIVRLERSFILWLSHFHIWKNNILSYVKYSKKAKKWYSAKHNPNYLYIFSIFCWFYSVFCFSFLFFLKIITISLLKITCNRNSLNGGEGIQITICFFTSFKLSSYHYISDTMVAVYTNIHFLLPPKQQTPLSGQAHLTKFPNLPHS